MKNSKLYSILFNLTFKSSVNLFIIFLLISNQTYSINSTDTKDQLASASSSLTQLDSPISNFYQFDRQNSLSKHMNNDENRPYASVFNFLNKQPTSLKVIKNDDDAELIRSNVGKSNREYIRPFAYRRREDRAEEEENAEKDKYEEDELNNDKLNRDYNSRANKEIGDEETNEPSYETENNGNGETGSYSSTDTNDANDANDTNDTNDSNDTNDTNDENKNGKHPDYNDVNYDEQKNQRKIEKDEARANKVDYDWKEEENLATDDEENSIRNEDDDKMNEDFKDNKSKLIENANENTKKLNEENPIDIRFSPLQTYSRQFTPKTPKFFSFFSSFDNAANVAEKNIKETLKEDDDEEFMRDDPSDNLKDMGYVFDMNKQKSENLDKVKLDQSSKFNKPNKSAKTKEVNNKKEKSKKEVSKFMDKKKEKVQENDKKDDKLKKDNSDKYNKETKEPKDVLIEKEDSPDVLGDGSKFEKNEELLIELLKKRVLSNQQRLLEIKKQEQRKQFQNEIDESFYLRKINQEVQKYGEIEKKLNRLINLIQNQQKYKNLNRLSNYPSTKDIYNSLSSSFGDSFDSAFGNSLNNQGNLQTLEQKFFEQKLMPNNKKNRSRPLSLFGSNAYFYPPNRFPFYRPLTKPISNHPTSNQFTNNLNGWFSQLATSNKNQQTQSSFPRAHYSNLNYPAISSTDYPVVKRYPIFKKIKSNDEKTTQKSVSNTFNNLASNIFGARQIGSTNLIKSILQPTSGK